MMRSPSAEAGPETGHLAAVTLLGGARELMWTLSKTITKVARTVAGRGVRGDARAQGRRGGGR